MKWLVGVVVASALVEMPTVAHADKPADDCLAGGRTLDGKGRHADAIAAWKACLATTPDDAILESEIGAAAFQLHDLDVAEQFARAAIEHAHTNEPSVEAGARYTLGRVQEQRKDTTRAIASYTESLTLRASPVVRARLVALDPTARIPIPTSVPGVVPAAFKEIVDAQKAELKMRLVSWWQDDLDGDGKDEHIAELCNDDVEGVYLIEHGGDLLVARRESGGRDPCPAETKPAPGWQRRHQHDIDLGYSVHGGSERIHIAVRGHLAVKIYEGEDNADHQLEVDWDALTISDVKPDQPPKPTPIVAVADADPRWTSVAKGVALSATVVGDKVILHVKSAAQVVVSFCPASDDDPACNKQLAKPVHGVADLTVPDPSAKVGGAQTTLELEAAGIKSHALLLRAVHEVFRGYPSAASTEP